MRCPTRLLAVSLTLGAFLAGCSTEPSPTASAIAANGNTSFNGVVATAVTAPSVLVTSSKGGGFAGAQVTFTASNGSTVTGATVTTGADGIATVGSWVLGQTAGSYTLTATLGTFPAVTFTATAAAGPPASVTVVSGSGQTSPVNSAVTNPLVARVTDQYNNPVNNVGVTFQVATGGGSIPAGPVATDAQGQASKAGWVLGTVSGINTLNATAGSATPAVFQATGAAGAPASLAMAGGDAQAGGLGTALPLPLSAKVADVFGNGVPGIAVTFAQTTGNVTLGSPNAITNGSGLATTTLTLNAVGPSTVTATSSGFTPTVFSASTGPTITGQITLPNNPVGMGPALTALATASARSAGLVGVPSLPTARGRVTQLDPAASARRVVTRGHLVVTFRPGSFSLSSIARDYASANIAAQATAAYSAALAPHVRSGRIIQRQISPAIAAARILVAPGANQEDVIRELKADPRVATVEEEQLLYSLDTQLEELPPATAERLTWKTASPIFGPPATERYATDPMLDQQLWHYQMIDAFRVWPLTTGSNTVRVAVIDTGARPEHPALAGILSTTENFDFVDGVNDGYVPAVQTICSGGGTFTALRGTAAHLALPRNVAQDPLQVSWNGACWAPSNAASHGTHVIGTIASAANDGVAGTGVTWNTKVIAIRGLGITGSGWSFDIAQAILYAGGLPATFVGSPGGATVSMPAAHIISMSLGGTTFSTVISDAVAAVQGTSLIIAAAGNNNNSTLFYPAAYPGVLAVSALGPNYSRAPYSNFGSYVSVSAPGGATSLGTTSGVLSSLWDYVTNTPTYGFYQGTSMATPHVAGVAALIKAANPSFTPTQIKDRLTSTATDLGTPGKDNTYGFGLVNAYRAVVGNAPTATTTVKAINEAGTVVRSIAPSPSGEFTMTNLPAGNYLIVAGQDEAGDGLFGTPGRRFGGAPALQAVSGTQVKNVAFNLSALPELEPNDASATAQTLAVNSWVSGTIGGGDTKDVYTVMISTAGTYTFETSGVLGACGLALEANTVLRLTNSTGTQLALNDNTAYPTASYPGTLCSLISTALTPGQYFVEVSAASGISGSYRLHIRSGN